MNDKIFKSSVFVIILIVFLVFIASGVNAANSSEDTTVLSLAKGGLSIHYPSVQTGAAISL